MHMCVCITDNHGSLSNLSMYQTAISLIRRAWKELNRRARGRKRNCILINIVLKINGTHESYSMLQDFGHACSILFWGAKTKQQKKLKKIEPNMAKL